MPREVETSKKLSALRQIHAAIEHLNKAEFECAMTLAAAAEGQLPETERKYIFQIFRRHVSFKELDFNLVINWLKHPFKPETATISEFEVAITVARAVTKFHAVYGQSTRQMESFVTWARESGHVPFPGKE